MLLAHDPNRFTTGGSGFLGTGEESSGILDVTSLFDAAGTSGLNYYLLTSMSHNVLGGELVEGGQLLLMTAPVPEPTSLALTAAAAAAVLALRRRRAAAPTPD